MRAYAAAVSVPGTNLGTEMTVTPTGRMLVTRRKFRLAIPASMSARSNAVSSVRPSPLPATIEMALGCSHMRDHLANQRCLSRTDAAGTRTLAHHLSAALVRDAAAFLFHPPLTAPAREDFWLLGVLC